MIWGRKIAGRNFKEGRLEEETLKGGRTTERKMIGGARGKMMEKGRMIGKCAPLSCSEFVNVGVVGSQGSICGDYSLKLYMHI